jgi:GTP-binding protein HflX
MGPRIYGLGGTYFSRQAGGIGGRGIGETNIELMKRHWREQIKKKRDQLEKISRRHELQIQRRKENNLQTISIVGYTNAGKTSLFNALTKKTKIVENALFVTLDSVTGKIYLPTLKKEVTISDTIGFIKDLPASLIDTFKSTLMESVNADLLLHVIDISDPKMYEKIDIVEEVLKQLRVNARRIIYVFNKIDAFKGDGKKLLTEIKNKYGHFEPQFISVSTSYGIANLKDEIERSLG